MPITSIWNKIKDIPIDPTNIKILICKCYELRFADEFNQLKVTIYYKIHLLKLTKNK